MKSTFAAIAAVAAFGFAAAAHAGVTPLTAYDDDGNPMPGSGAAVTAEDRAREAAAEGPQALRWFVQRTRMIYALNIRDFPTANDGFEHAELAVRDNEKELAELREQIARDMQYE
jgi:hypothetical protein